MSENPYKALHDAIDALQRVHEAEIQRLKAQIDRPPVAQSGNYKRLLTQADLAEYLNIGKSKAFELLHTDGFPTIKLGRRIFANRELLDQWLDNQTF